MIRDAYAVRTGVGPRPLAGGRVPRPVIEIIERDDGLINGAPADHYLAEPAEWQPHDHRALRTVPRPRARHRRRRRADRARAAAPRHGRDRPGHLAPARSRWPASAGCGTRCSNTVDGYARAAARYDTFLLLGNNLGLLEGPERAPVFLAALAALANPGARIIAHGTDPYGTTDPVHAGLPPAQPGAGPARRSAAAAAALPAAGHRMVRLPGLLGRRAGGAAGRHPLAAANRSTTPTGRTTWRSWSSHGCDRFRRLTLDGWGGSLGVSWRTSSARSAWPPSWPGSPSGCPPWTAPCPPTGRCAPTSRTWSAAGVTVVPPPGAVLDVTGTRPGDDEGTALFRLGPVRYAIAVQPFDGTLAMAAAPAAPADHRHVPATRSPAASSRSPPAPGCTVCRAATPRPAAAAGTPSSSPAT